LACFLWHLPWHWAGTPLRHHFAVDSAVKASPLLELTRCGRRLCLGGVRFAHWVPPMDRWRGGGLLQEGRIASVVP
jgi:hypothetical protein